MTYENKAPIEFKRRIFPLKVYVGLRLISFAKKKTLKTTL